MCAWSLQLCLTLCDPVDYSLPGSSVHGILEARILEWLPCPPSGVLPDPGIEQLQEGGPVWGLKPGSCLTLRNELSEEIPVLTKQEILLGKGTRVESSRVREPRRTALPHGWQSCFMVMGLVSGCL